MTATPRPEARATTRPAPPARISANAPATTESRLAVPTAHAATTQPGARVLASTSRAGATTRPAATTRLTVKTSTGRTTTTIAFSAAGIRTQAAVSTSRPDDKTTPTPVHAPTGEGPPGYDLIHGLRHGGADWREGGDICIYCDDNVLGIDRELAERDLNMRARRRHTDQGPTEVSDGPFAALPRGSDMRAELAQARAGDVFAAWSWR
ncbi:hypothetical protein K438DRAFT_2168852 [Mycena galopus ATCC 62051]|nr:hypothetical protein K438DRAFT_2168852 [Mycena galopus ATCC 62051]